MLEIRHLTKQYGEKTAVDDLTLTIRPGEIFGFIGPNGAGKTTTLKCCCGILQPDRGEVRVNGCSMRDDPLAAKRQLAYLPDDPALYGYMTGIQYLDFIADVFGVREAARAERVRVYGERFALTEALGQPISSYSHGMRQKMMVMGALLPNPDVWVLDEPMTGLDPKAAWLLKQSMREHADAGKTVLFSTHVLDVAEKVVDRVGIVAHGELLFVGTVDQMREHFRNNGSLEEMFLELTGENSPLAGAGSVAEDAGAPAEEM